VTDSRTEKPPLPVWLYDLVQRVTLAGARRLYAPIRQETFAWAGVPERDILEVGAGLGVGLARLGSRGLALELDEVRLRVAVAGGRTGLVADGRRLPFSDRSFRIVYSEAVLHHVDDAGSTQLVRDMLRVCRPDGRVVVMDSVWPRSIFRFVPWLLRRADRGRHVRTEEQLLAVLAAAGGEIVSAPRITYSWIGLECLLVHLRPKR
jgi:SAM-dependent methyltransferase